MRCEAGARWRRALLTRAAAVLALLVLAGAFTCPFARSSDLRGKVVILVIDRTGPGDITPGGTPFLARLANRWSSGIMVTRTGERDTGREPDNCAGCVTLAAGTRARGAAGAELSFERGELLAGAGSETSAGSYSRLASGTATPPGGSACLGMAAVVAGNTGGGTSDSVGLLGRELARAGKVAAVAGNQDSLTGPVRCSALIVSGPGGKVPQARLAGLTRRAPPRPGGMVTDMEGLLAASRELLSRSDLLVIDTGDTGRADRERLLTGAGAFASARAGALRRADSFASRLAREMDLGSSLLLVVSPAAPTEARMKGNFATPFIAAGKGFSRGLISSPSTRRAGFVNNTDLAATVLRFFGLPAPPQPVGAAMNTAGKAPGGATNLEHIAELDRQYMVTREARWPVVLAYLGCIGVFLVLSLACIPAVGARIGIVRRLPFLMRVLRPAAVVLLAAPASFLLVSAFSFDGWTFPLVFCAAYALAVGLAAYFVAGPAGRPDAVTLVCLLSAGVMMVDLLFGGRLLVFPLLGSSVQDGMRFFGISNAVSGMLIAYGVFGAVGLARDSVCAGGPARRGVFAGLAVLAFFVGFGLLGGDFGGFVTTVVTCLVLFFATGGRRFDRRRMLVVVGGAIGAAAALVVADAVFVHTHTSQALSAGSQQVFGLVGRKAVILLAQIRSVLVLALVMVASVVAIVLWMRRPGSFWEARWRSDRAFTSSLFALLSGSIVALLLNDTGIGMMGTMVMVAIPVTGFHFMTKAPGGAPGARRNGCGFRSAG